ncbi:MAG: hypothetical protein ACREAK_06190 [Nitrosarchaeum sp.]
MRISTLLVLTVFLVTTIMISPAIPQVFAHVPSTITLTEQAPSTNLKVYLAWSSGTVNDNNHYTELSMCGGSGCTPIGTLTYFPNGGVTSYTVESLPPNHVFGFKVFECHKTNHYQNLYDVFPKMCTASNTIYVTVNK